jgi:hypothetical protein
VIPNIRRESVREDLELLEIRGKQSSAGFFKARQVSRDGREEFVRICSQQVASDRAISCRIAPARPILAPGILFS